MEIVGYEVYEAGITSLQWCEVQLSEIAKIFGGGGHKAASGSPISDNVRNDIIKIIFNLQE